MEEDRYCSVLIDYVLAVEYQRRQWNGIKLQLDTLPFGGDCGLECSPRPMKMLLHQKLDIGAGSKDETFFDSQAWLESDCEDDFLSVNGDFTPSRGNTPVHHNFSTETPRVNKAHLEDRIPGSTSEPSPKKKLVELFRESNQQDLDIEGENTSGNQNISKGKIKVKQTLLDLLPNSAHDTPYGTNSVCSSERIPNGDLLTEKEKPIRPVQCCLPSLISCRSFSERKKKMEPAIAVID